MRRASWLAVALSFVAVTGCGVTTRAQCGAKYAGQEQNDCVACVDAEGAFQGSGHCVNTKAEREARMASSNAQQAAAQQQAQQQAAAQQQQQVAAQQAYDEETARSRAARPPAAPAQPAGAPAANVSTTWYGVATFTGVGECDAAIATKVKPADDKAVEQAAYECNSCLRGGAPAIVWRVFRNRGEPVKWACMPDNSN